MNLILSDILPGREAVLLSQGIPKNAEIKGVIQELLTEAIAIFSAKAQPIGILSEVSIKEFRGIFNGKGQNAPDPVLQNIFPRAESLALFALTMGSQVSDSIEDCFKKDDFALGAMLDSVASLGAENSVGEYEKYFLKVPSNAKNASTAMHVLGYSPGYCGWHISAQEKLFTFLHPEKIGISLNDSCLMTPIKSVTGVLVKGRKEIHIFNSGFSFCTVCTHKSCHQRIKKLKAI